MCIYRDKKQQNLLDSYLILATPFPASVKEISGTSAAPQSALAIASTGMHGRVFSFVSKFPTHYRQFRTIAIYGSVFSIKAGGRVHFLLSAQKTVGASS